MSAGPPSYPRIPHVASSPAASRDDLVLDALSLKALLSGPVRVEEKLDGANVSVRTPGGAPRVGTRGGEDARDRSGLRGRVRGWAAQHADGLATQLGEELVLYGEWLLHRHRVVYDRLPGPLIGLDLHDQIAGRFLDVTERDRQLDAAGIPRPPELHTGTVNDLDELRALLGPSAVGAEAAEGLIVRPLHPGPGTPRIAKLVAPGYVRPSDAELGGPGVENRVLLR